MGRNSLILTNQNLILVKKTLTGHVKDTLRFPLQDIMVANGEAQVHMGTVNIFTPTLDIYFTSGRERFRFEWDTQVKEWIRSINAVVTGAPMPKEEDSWMEDFADLQGFAESVAGSVNKLKRAFGQETPQEVSCRCPSCGASLTGIKGETVRCPYCASYYTFS